MAPKREKRTWKMENGEREGRMMFEEEMKALRNIIEDQNEQLEAVELWANTEIKNHEDSFKDMMENYEKEIEKLKIQVEDKNKKFEEVKNKTANNGMKFNDVLKQRIIIEAQKNELDAFKSKSDEEEKNYQEIVQVMINDSENDKKEINSLKTEIEEEKEKLKVLTAKHDHFIDQLKDKLECPVCLEVPRTGPVSVCPNGHFVCKKCKINSCPTCRVGMGIGKSLLAVTIIENIDHKCKFDDCEDTFALDKLEDHFKVCDHRTVSCPYARCNKKVGLSRLVDHLSKSTCSYEYTPRMVYNYEITEEFDMDKDTKSRERNSDMWKVSLYSYKGLSFALIVEKYDGFYFFSFVMFSSESVSSKYKIEITVHGPDCTSQDSEVSFRFCGAPCSIDQNKVKFRNSGLTVISDGMEKILWKNENDDYDFKVSFCIMKKC